jgi:hypothetical protein
LVIRKQARTSTDTEHKMTLSNYTNPNDNYKPSPNVALAAGITQNADFGTLLTPNLNVIIAFLGAPIALAVLGLISCLFMNLGWLSRCCFTCSRCLPDGSDICALCCSSNGCCPYAKEADEEETKKKAVTHRRRATYGALCVFLLLTLVADMISFSGNASVLKGVRFLFPLAAWTTLR